MANPPDDLLGCPECVAWHGPRFITTPPGIHADRQTRTATMNGPLRRVIPTGYRVYSLTLVGTSPLLMSSADTDRLSDTYLAYRTLSKKRSKTIEDENRLRELEWYTRLYYEPDVGPFIPGRNVKELLRSAATQWRRGEDVKRSLIIPDNRIPLVYDGPRDPAKLWAAGFAYTTMARNSGAGRGSVDRTRPMFAEWSLETEAAFDPEDISDHDLGDFVDRSQKYGLGDYRPEFGSFQAECKFIREQKKPTKAKATHRPDSVREDANGKRTKVLID